MSKISTAPIAREQLGEHIALASTVYSTVKVTDPVHFGWKHCDSPFGASLCVASRADDGRLVGRMLLQPRLFVTGDGREVSGATATDFVVDPAHRNAMQMIGMVKATKSPPGIDLLIHSSNEVSDPLYSQLFKFKSEFELTALGLPVRLNKLARRKVSSDLLCRAIDAGWAPLRLALRLLTVFDRVRTGLRFGSRPSDAVLEAVLAGFRSSAGPHFARTPAFMAWRFDSSPVFESHVEWLWKRGECLGFFAWQRIDKGDVGLLTITDLVTRRPLSRQEARAVKLLAATRCIERGLDAVLTLVNTNNAALAVLDGFPLYRIPASQMPHPSPMYFHASSATLPVGQRAKTYLTLADLDYF